MWAFCQLREAMPAAYILRFARRSHQDKIVLGQEGQGHKQHQTATDFSKHPDSGQRPGKQVISHR